MARKPKAAPATARKPKAIANTETACEMAGAIERGESLERYTAFIEQLAIMVGRIATKPLGAELKKTIEALADYKLLRDPMIGQQVTVPEATAIIKIVHGDATGAQAFADKITRGGDDPRARAPAIALLKAMISKGTALAHKQQLKDALDNATK